MTWFDIGVVALAFGCIIASVRGSHGIAFSCFASAFLLEIMSIAIDVFTQH